MHSRREFLIMTACTVASQASRQHRSYATHRLADGAAVGSLTSYLEALRQGLAEQS
jgi:hypothetical protein